MPNLVFRSLIVVTLLCCMPSAAQDLETLLTEPACCEGLDGCSVAATPAECLAAGGAPVPGELCCALDPVAERGCLGASCYTGPLGSEGIGTCQAGAWSCGASGSVECSGEVTPTDEACDGLDDDCDGAVDEGFDRDSDGFTSCGGDCDDDDRTVHPGAAEVCDGADNDCDGVVDEGCPVCGNGIAEGTERCDGTAGVPGGGQVTCHPPGHDHECNFDFSGVTQLYCNGNCSWTGGYSCDQADADLFCRLRLGEPGAVATSFTIETALPEPGFPCNGYGISIGPMPEYGVTLDVRYQETSILANHGAGYVVTQPTCVVP